MPVALNEQHRAQHGPGRCRPAANGPDHAAVALCPPFQVGDVRQRLLALLETLLSRLRLLGLGLRQPLGLAPDLLRDRRQIPPPSRGNRTAAPSVSSSSIASRSASRRTLAARRSMARRRRPADTAILSSSPVVGGIFAVAMDPPPQPSWQGSSHPS